MSLYQILYLFADDFVIHINNMLFVYVRNANMKNVLMSTTDHCNSYILLRQVIAITTVTLIVLRKLNCYTCSRKRRLLSQWQHYNIIIMDNTIFYNTYVIVTFCELSNPMHQCDNKCLLLWQTFVRWSELIYYINRVKCTALEQWTELVIIWSVCSTCTNPCCGHSYSCNVLICWFRCWKKLVKDLCRTVSSLIYGSSSCNIWNNSIKLYMHE